MFDVDVITWEKYKKSSANHYYLTPNSRVDGARPNHQPIRGSDPKYQGIWIPPRAGLGPVRYQVP